MRMISGECSGGCIYQHFCFTNKGASDVLLKEYGRTREMKGMKRTRIIALAMLMVMIISMLPVSEVSAKTTKKAGPVLRENSAVLYLKDKYATSCQLQIDNAASNAEITYKSSNSKVATVSSTGKVTPLKKGKATITAVVKQNRKKYTLSFDCTVKKASLSFGTSKAKNTTGEKAASIEVGKTLKTGLRLNGEIASVYTKSNTENYNVRATVYSAKTGKKLASYKNAGDNKYVTVSENGRITGNKAGRYYIDFTSYPKGLSSRIYVTVSKAKKPKTPEKTENVETPEVPTESEDGEEDGKQSDAGTVFVTPAPYAQNIPDVPTTPAPSKDDKHTKYLVSFKAAKGMENIGAELPEAAEYEDGTLVDKLPTPYLFNGIFILICTNLQLFRIR